MTIFGVDCIHVPDPAGMAASGVRFVSRYISYPGGLDKDILKPEADAIRAAGMALMLNWEDSAVDGLGGYNAGVKHATYAETRRKELGAPDSTAIYFSQDFDVTPAQQGAVNAYLQGAASVLGVDRVGVYGSYWCVKRAFDAGVVSYGWQTYAWSGGQWDPRAQVQQYSNSHALAGADVDYDRAMVPLDQCGMWLPADPGGPPDVNLTDVISFTGRDGKPASMTVAQALSWGYINSANAVDAVNRSLAAVQAVGKQMGVAQADLDQIQTVEAGQLAQLNAALADLPPAVTKAAQDALSGANVNVDQAVSTAVAEAVMAKLREALAL